MRLTFQKKSNGGFGQNRTADTRIFSPLLYRLSYEAKNKMAVPTGFEPAIFCVTGRRDNHYTTGPFGCGRWIWTNDLRVMSPTSYQAAPPRVKLCEYDTVQVILCQHFLWFIFHFFIGGERGIRTPAPLPTCRFSRPVPSTRLGYFSTLYFIFVLFFKRQFDYSI